MDIPTVESNVKEKQMRKDEKPEDNKHETKTKKTKEETWVLKDSFSKIRDTEGNVKEIKCSTCDSSFSPLSGNSTLQRHLTICPKKPLDQKNTIQKKMEDYSLAKPKLPTQEDLEKLLMNWVITSNQTFQEMDNPAFISFINGLKFMGGKSKKFRWFGENGRRILNTPSN